MENEDRSPNDSFKYGSLIGKGLIECEDNDDIKYISLPSQTHLDQFSSLRLRNKRKTMMGMTREGFNRNDGDFILQPSRDTEVLETYRVGDASYIE